MPALRCSICGISWPLDPDEYDICPSCELPTDPISNDVPSMSDTEAASMKNGFLFDRFYAKWDDEQTDDRLVPTKEENERFTLEKWRAQVEADGKAVKTVPDTSPKGKFSPPSAGQLRQSES